MRTAKKNWNFTLVSVYLAHRNKKSSEWILMALPSYYNVARHTKCGIYFHLAWNAFRLISRPWFPLDFFFFFFHSMYSRLSGIESREKSFTVSFIELNWASHRIWIIHTIILGLSSALVKSIAKHFFCHCVVSNILRRVWLLVRSSYIWQVIILFSVIVYTCKRKIDK